MNKLVWAKREQRAVLGVEMWEASFVNCSFHIIKNDKGFFCICESHVTNQLAFPDFKKYHSSLGEAQKVCQQWANKLGA